MTNRPTKEKVERALMQVDRIFADKRMGYSLDESEDSLAILAREVRALREERFKVKLLLQEISELKPWKIDSCDVSAMAEEIIQLMEANEKQNERC